MTTPHRRKSFSIRFLLGVVGGCAVALWVWRSFIYEPPTHKIPLYEKAPMTRHLSAEIGPNTVSIASVARNDRDGTVSVETGKGQTLTRTVPQQKQLADCGTWLDVVQFEITPGPDRFEIIDARIFDHTKRTLIFRDEPAFGWQVVQPNLLHVYGLGKEVPQLLDVWLRAHTYQPDAVVHQLPPTPDATVKINQEVITISEIQAGFVGWSSDKGFMPVSGKHHVNTAVVLECIGPGLDDRYQIAAVSRNGDKQFEDRFLRFGPSSGPKQVLVFDFAWEDIQHFELRPFGGRERFFFEAVRLPKPSGQPFGAPPNATLQIDGKETTRMLTELAPLRVKATVRNGRVATGSQSGDRFSRLVPQPDGPTEVDQSFTMLFDLSGVPSLPFSLVYSDTQTGVPFSKLSARSSSRAHGARSGVDARVYPVPIQRLETVKVSLTPLP